MNVIKMKSLWFLLYVSFINGRNQGNRSFSGKKIVSGNNVKISDYPYQAAVIEDGDILCGACLISDTWLVSAAHCFIDILKFVEALRVRVGSRFKSKGGSLHIIERVVMHEDYNNDTLENDICLIELLNSIAPDPNKKPIPVFGRNATFIVGTKVKISGWGHTDTRARTSEILKAATVYVVSNWVCRRLYEPKAVRPSMFCATASTASSCSGDSGGPAVIRGKLAGIISASVGCWKSINPILLTQLSRFYSWIEDKTGLML